MKQPSTRRLFSYKQIKTACAGCKKSRKAQRHETAFRLAKSSSASKHQEPQSVNTMKQPSTRRLFSYKQIKTACAGCKKSRKAQRHETAFRLAKSSSASKHHGCQRRGKTVSASLSRPRSRQRRLRARRPQYQQYHGARRRVLPYRHGRVVHGHRMFDFSRILFSMVYANSALGEYNGFYKMQSDYAFCRFSVAIDIIEDVIVYIKEHFNILTI